MPVQVLSAEERQAWSRFPERIEEDALGAFFTLPAGESGAIRRLYGDQNRLAVALQVCSLRWLGFIPDDLWSRDKALAVATSDHLKLLFEDA